MQRLLPLLLLAASASAPVDHPRTYLVSIVGLKLTRNEYVDHLKVDTWGVTFKAVCHIPPGWTMKAGSTAAPDGEIEGEASHGVTFINSKSQRQLSGMVLLTLYTTVQRADIGRLGDAVYVPATFKGEVNVGTYGEDKERKIHLTHANIRLVPASRCPAPAD